MYAPFQQRLDTRLEAAGYRRGEAWLTLKFEGTEHSERAWRKRVQFALKFLLGVDLHVV